MARRAGKAAGNIWRLKIIKRKLYIIIYKFQTRKANVNLEEKYYVMG